MSGKVPNLSGKCQGKVREFDLPCFEWTLIMVHMYNEFNSIFVYFYYFSFVCVIIYKSISVSIDTKKNEPIKKLKSREFSQYSYFYVRNLFSSAENYILRSSEVKLAKQESN